MFIWIDLGVLSSSNILSDWLNISIHVPTREMKLFIFFSKHFYFLDFMTVDNAYHTTDQVDNNHNNRESAWTRSKGHNSPIFVEKERLEQEREKKCLKRLCLCSRPASSNYPQVTIDFPLSLTYLQQSIAAMLVIWTSCWFF